MATPGTSSIGRLIMLMDEAYRLKNIIDQSSRDTALIKRGVIIQHMVDTPVFRIFAEPEHYSRMVSAFPSLYQPEEAKAAEESAGEGGEPGQEIEKWSGPDHLEAEDSTLFANALITGEYIFRVAAATGAQQVLISPEHSGEIYSYILSLTRRAERSATESPDKVDRAFADLGGWLAQQASTFKIAGGDRSLWLDRVRQGVIDRLAGVGDSSTVAQHRLASLFSKNLIRHAADALNFDPSLISPPRDIVRAWQLRISFAKRRNYQQPNPHALEADAITLSQLQMYNDEWHKDGRVCVLITNDRGLQRAYGAWLREQPGAGRRAFNAIRDPRQYMPILNVGDNTGGFTDAEVFSRVKASVNQLLTSFASTDEPVADGSSEAGFAHVTFSDLAKTIKRRLAEQDSQLKPFTTLLQAQIEEVATAWLDLLEYSVVAKSDIVADLAEAEMKLWQEVSHDVLKRKFSGQISKVADQFVQLTASSALLRLEVWAFDQRGLPVNTNRRRLATEYTDFSSEAFAGQTIAEIIDNLRHDLGQSISGLQAADAKERLLVIGCLCLEIGAWAAARSLLGIAAKSAAGPVKLVREIRFFQCVARRLAATHKTLLSEYAQVEEDLDTMLATGHSDSGDQARLRNEAVALLLCKAAFLAFENKPHKTELRKAARTWERLVEWEAGRLVAEQTMPMWQAMLKQFSLNSFCLIYWLTTAKMRLPPTLTDLTQHLLATVERKASSYIAEGVHGDIYPDLARYALSREDDDRPALAARITGNIQRALMRDAEAAFLFDIPYVDKTELQCIGRDLARRHGLDDPSLPAVDTGQIPAI